MLNTVATESVQATIRPLPQDLRHGMVTGDEEYWIRAFWVSQQAFGSKNWVKLSDEEKGALSSRT
jgi:hypothetical protein